MSAHLASLTSIHPNLQVCQMLPAEAGLKLGV